MKKPPFRSTGFTLIEIVVVITVLAILAILLVHSIQSAIRASQDTNCLTNLRNLGFQLLTYASDNNGTLPSRQLQKEGKRVYYWMEPLKRGGYVIDHAPKNALFFCPLGPESDDRNECYGLRAWEGEAIQRDAELPLARIPNRADFFLLADSINYNGAAPRQWYTIQKSGHGNAIHLRHRGFAYAVFADGSTRAKSRSYFENIHLHNPSLTKDPFEVLDSQ